MYSVKFDRERTFLVRAEHNSDLIKFITEFAEKNKITVAIFTGLGALKCGKIGFYDQEKHHYQTLSIDFPNEIVSCIGNISLKEGKPFVHAHVVVSDRNGNTKAGHLVEGIVFAAEIHLQEMKGTKLERKFDETTGLSLWKK